MVTIQIENNSEQAQALTAYLATLPFVTFVNAGNDTGEMPKEEEDKREEDTNTEGIAIAKVVVKEAEEVMPVVEIVVKETEEEVHDKPFTGMGGNTFSETFEKRLLSDLRKSLNLNDKFRFQRDLFRGNSDEMIRTLEYLNGCSSLSEACNYLEKQYGWDSENESAAAFRAMLEKRYS